MNRYLTELATRKRPWDIPVGIASVLVGVVAVEVWLEDSPADEDFIIWLLAHLAVVALVLWPLYAVVRRRLRQRRAGRIAERLAGLREASIPLNRLDATLGVKNCAPKIADLKRRGFLQRIELDGQSLLLGDPEPDRAEEESASEPTSIVRDIRQLNDEIDDAMVSERIDRIERATAGILRTIEERPERAAEARKFMNYYLPTTMKLLESYRLMEKQSYQGENIQASRRQIEAVLDKLAAAAERQQDQLFRSEALDVETDIRVLETMMASDGLTREGGLPLGTGV